MSNGSNHFQRSVGRSGFRLTCGVCGKIHAGPCQWDNVCFQCGQTGLFRRECPNRGSSQTKISESGAQFQRASGHGGLNTQTGHTLSGSFSTEQQYAPAARGRVYAMTSQEAQVTPDVMIGTLSIFGNNARVLINPGAIQSFISCEYVARVGMTPVPLGCGLEIATPTRESLWSSQMLKGSLFSIEGQVMEADLILINLKRLDVILGRSLVKRNC